MNRIVKLNVGDCLYTTTQSTLTRDPSSMLATIFSGELDPSIREGYFNGAYFIDRDGPIFRHVLNFLRQGSLILPEDFKEWDLLVSDADFYKLGALAEAVKEEKCRVIKAKDAAKNPKFEIIEIEQGDDMYIVKYIGSSETLQNLPGLLQILNAFHRYVAFGEKNILGIVKEEGGYEAEMRDYSRIQPALRTPNCLFIFHEILNHGFELKTAPCSCKSKDEEDGMKWTFLRKI